MAKNYMIGNWKMNQSLKDIDSFFNELDLHNNQNNFWIAPQTLHISKCIELASKKGILIGSQNISEQNNGAFTGEISSESFMEMGGHFSIIGHSERRQYFHESDELINKKVIKAFERGLVPVLCIGETLAEREADKTLNVVLGQLKAGVKNLDLNNEAEVIIAYEPVWAIGTGKTASPEQAEEVHNAIRAELIKIFGDTGLDISILYGGSVKPENIVELLSKPNINGGLVGGASLDAKSFTKLCAAC